MSERLRAILFDFDGVVRAWDWGKEGEMESQFGLPVGTLQAIAFEPGLLGKAVRGEITDEAWRAEVRRSICAQHGEKACGVVEQWAASAGAVNKEVLAIAGALRPRFRIGLLTNGTTRLARDMEQLGLVGRFDEVINSADTKVEKPTARAYAVAAERMGFPAAQCLLIDDSTKHVAGAKSAGMDAILFEGVGKLREELARRGIAV